MPETISIAELKEGLTDDQSTAFDNFLEFYRAERGYHTLIGYAGTGKTYTLTRIIKFLLSEKKSVVVGCPTNKAIKSFKRIAKLNDLEVDAYTIAQLLGQIPILDENTGKENFKSENEVKINDYDFLLVDEGYMVNRESIEEIISHTYGSGTKVSFIGDSKQLPPVKEKTSCLVNNTLITHKSMLTEVVRYSGEIAVAAEQIRSDTLYNRVPYPFKTSDDQSIICLPGQDWLDKMVEYFLSEQYLENPDHCRVLAWRNRRVGELNQYLHDTIFGKESPLFHVGDRLIAKSPIFRLKPDKKPTDKDKWRIIIANSEEATVIEVKGLETKKVHSLPLEFWNLTIRTDDGQQFDVRLLTDEAIENRQSMINAYKKTRKWGAMWDLIRSFDAFVSAKCLTTHKSQGSSIGTVFLDIVDMKDCSDRQAILYTALTRAENRAYILK